MIIDAADLDETQKLAVAQKVSLLSQKTNSSLLFKSIEDVTHILASQETLVDMHEEQARFITTFEPTGDPLFVEVGMTCNLAPEQIRGKHIFPHIIDFYRKNNGNGKKVLYLTTTDIRMWRIAEESGFRQLDNIHDFFPATVLDFCCSPCSAKKTGTSHGQQINYCPRFEGDFLVQIGEPCTRQPCRVLAQTV